MTLHAYDKTNIADAVEIAEAIRKATDDQTPSGLSLAAHLAHLARIENATRVYCAREISRATKEHF